MEKSMSNQPAPSPGDRLVGLVVLQDMAERIEFGFNKHGYFLETENGRDSLWDAYEEALDLCMYLRQEILQREKRKKDAERQLSLGIT